MEKIVLSQAAIALHVSRERAMRLVLAGELEGELIAGRWLVSRDSLEQLLARRHRGSSSDESRSRKCSTRSSV